MSAEPPQRRSAAGALGASGWALSALVVLGGGAGAPASAQQYGQWWWDGRLGYGERSYDNALGGEPVQEYAERRVALSLGVHGYLGHPLLGDFTLGVGAQQLDLSGSRPGGNESLDYSLTLNALPRSIFPVALGVRRSSYDFSAPEGDGGARRGARIDETESYFVALRPRTGWLRGAFLRHEETSTGYSDPAYGIDSRARSRLTWTRRAGPVDNRLAVTRNRDVDDFVGYATEDWSANLNQTGLPSDRLQWQVATTARRFASEVGALPTRTDDDLRLLASLNRNLREHDQLQLAVESAFVRPGSGVDSDAYGATASYRVRVLPGLDLAPFVQAGRVTSDDSVLSTLRGGLSAFWSRRSGTAGYSLSAGLSNGVAESTRGRESADEDQSAWSVAGSLELGDPARLRFGLQANLATNQLRVASPDSGAGSEPPLLASGAVDEDVRRAELRLERQHRGSGVSFSADVSSRSSTPLASSARLETTSTHLTFQVYRRATSFTANAGRSEAEAGDEPPRSVDFVSAAVLVRPFRFLSLQSSYRRDERRATALPDLARDGWRAGLVFHLGQLDAKVDYFREREQVATDLERRNEGLSWSVSRRVAGWLPIVTSVRRRGEIR